MPPELISVNSIVSEKQSTEKLDVEPKAQAKEAKAEKTEKDKDKQ